ncbi:MBL fold metallo-hydrolase [Dechloromonas sp. HYN0024]|uniref:MBL fold metallo-hydrolase n=1 Tax=Dechloromonas sp. HYN0024 TaxID=2231055 RepID=UPI000E449458|nr:MBL fold metallo-hydrolase [Dechloromonas sp. HYN0024]AXS80508.1 MBL fold metallo-hydrolase [Dechloromonas sp. HYN0024]
MKKTKTIFQEGNHKWVAIVRDPDKANHLIDTNEYLVTHGSKGLLLDPGGAEIFPAVFSALSSEFDPSALSGIFASHQDPDTCSSLALWLEFNPQLRCHVSWLWAGFIPHFGGTAETFVAIPDEGDDINLDGLILRAVPAHYLHSSGNFHLYDKVAKLLFSGDVGAALLPAAESGLFVENFDAHIRHAEGFHRRWMGSNEAKRAWCERVSKIDIDMLCPQHGAIYQGADVQRFINWFDALQVGSCGG